ncbi:uncharacterized protein LOC110442727 [Mizuhopecten yessoensis]|uniref:uncharacterized protein LOC110442727 n=1 Tax=Mizuhopecten yessoensis TaxID=6573 RepID=UPI000B4599C3|nr:uncharacterized protein LOC110442727 [Mizuhopecten yessoensis]
MSVDGEPLMTLSTDPWMPNRMCVASNGDILVTQVSSFEKRLADTAGIVSRYTTHGKRMVTVERDRFGNTICPKFIAASRVSDLVVVTTLTNEENGGYNGHVVVMTGDLQVKFRYLSDGRVIPGDQQYHPDISTKHFCADSQDNIILGAVNLGSIEIIDKHGHKLKHLGQVDDMGCLAISRDNELWVGKTKGQVEVFKYT